MTTNIINSKKLNATKRILKDLQEIQSTPLTTVFAEPLENDLFTWHVNIKGTKGTDYEGCYIHLIMNIPENYPVSAPTVQLLTPVARSHVYGDWICLDMLETHYSGGLYTGWSTGYSILSILLQLQSFLLTEDEKGYKRNEDRIEKCIKTTKSFSCTCGHDMSKNMPFPCLKRETKEKLEKMELPFEILVEIFSFLTVEQTKKILYNSSISKFSYLNERRETICFHSKVTFEEDILGYGISIQKSNVGIIKFVKSPLDLISKTAFDEDGIRKGVWRESFEYFLPLYINKEHGKKSMIECEQRIQKIFGKSSFQPNDALNLIAMLMNTQVVNVMNGSVFGSIKALEGYAHFHRLMIAFCEKYPNLLVDIETKIENFIKNDSSRHKSQLPSIGDFIVLLSVSKKFKWKDVSPFILKETFIRNIFWINKKYKNIFKLKTSNEKLTRVSFETTVVSMRLLMFHEYFLNNFARPDGKSIEEIAKNYDNKYGRPTDEEKEDLQKSLFRIQKVKSFEEVLKNMKIEIKCPISQILRSSRLDSLKKNYHQEY
eukprot:gene3166-5482_t